MPTPNADDVAGGDNGRSSAPLRIVLFGTGATFALSCLKALFEAGHTILFVMPDIRIRSKLKRHMLRRWPPPQRFARKHGIPFAWYREQSIHKLVRDFRPDIICIGSFTQKIPQSLIEIAPLGAINVHPSLLPRHRGAQTMFSVYHDGDAETGVTIHRATPRFDAGAIIVQETVPVPRGYPVGQLLGQLVDLAGPLLVRALQMILAGAAERKQDEAAATRAARFNAATFTVPFDQWDVEQCWHFLSGFSARFKQSLTDMDGQEVRYTSVGGFSRSDQSLPPGTAESVEGGWLLYCKGGVIELRR